MEIPVVKIGPVSGQTIPTLISLQEGQVVRALVQSIDGEDVILNLKGVKILARGALDLAPGRSLLLEAVQVKPEGIVFKLLAATQEDMEELPETKGISQLLRKFFSGEAEPEEIIKALKILNETKNTELTQPNLSCLWWQNGSQQGEIYLWKEQEKKRGQLEAFKTVVIHFYTEHLGELWARLAQFSGKLTLTVITESVKSQTLFKKHLMQLESLLSLAGFELDQIKYNVGKVDSVFALASEEQMLEYYKGIDVKV